MKILSILDREGTVLVSDALNQRILVELIKSECSVTELARRLNVSTLKLWRRMQKLISKNMAELARTEKIGNIERKMYRSTAAGFGTPPFQEFTPRDPRLRDSFKIYSEIQKSLMVVLSRFSEIPNDADPIDYALYANMLAFAKVCKEPRVQQRILELDKSLSLYAATLSQKVELLLRDRN